MNNACTLKTRYLTKPLHWEPGSIREDCPTSSVLKTNTRKLTPQECATHLPCPLADTSLSQCSRIVIFHLRTYLSPCSKGKQEARHPSFCRPYPHLSSTTRGEYKVNITKTKTTKCYKNHAHNPQRAAVFPPVLAAVSGCPRARQDGHFVFSLLPTRVENRSPLESFLGSPVATNRI